jgi:hypothetical protein
MREQLRLELEAGVVGAEEDPHGRHHRRPA